MREEKKGWKICFNNSFKSVIEQNKRQDQRVKDKISLLCTQNQIFKEENILSKERELFIDKKSVNQQCMRNN